MNVDWGFYTENDQPITGNNCESCMSKCENDENCGSVECGRDQELQHQQTKHSHCSWWRNGNCEEAFEYSLDQNKQNYIWTCKKQGTF